MIKIDQLVKDFEACLGWPYVSPGGTGKDCSKTGIDCSGMFVRAFKLQNESIYHGSNYIWRKQTTEKGSIKGTGNKTYKQENARSAKQLEVGMAVFKWNDNTPAKYADGLGDYQHIGLVVSVDPLRIIHASTDGMKVKEDKTIGKWCAWAKLAKVNYQPKAEPKQEQPKEIIRRVACDVLNVRQAMSKQSSRLGILRHGEAVTIVKDNGEWCEIKYNNKKAFVMSQFLEG